MSDAVWCNGDCYLSSIRLKTTNLNIFSVVINVYSTGFDENSADLSMSASQESLNSEDAENEYLFDKVGI